MSWGGSISLFPYLHLSLSSLRYHTLSLPVPFFIISCTFVMPLSTNSNEVSSSLFPTSLRTLKSNSSNLFYELFIISSFFVCGVSTRSFRRYSQGRSSISCISTHLISLPIIIPSNVFDNKCLKVLFYTSFELPTTCIVCACSVLLIH